MWSGVRRWRGAGAVRHALLAGVALGVLLVLSARRDVSARVERVFPVEPRALAHLLADWRTQRALQPDGAGAGASTWRVEEESGEAAAWRYAVRAECGTRCAARAWLEAVEHGDGEHELRVHHRACSHLPLLPWPQLCDEWQSVTRVSGAERSGGGALFSETAVTRCAGWDGGCGARLQHALHARLLHLAALLGRHS